MNDNYCSICRNKFGLFTSKHQLADCVICNNCLKDMKLDFGLNTNSLSLYTVEDLQQGRFLTIMDFIETKKIEKNLRIDENNKLFLLYNDLFEYSNLLSFELLEDGETLTKGGLGRAVAGGLLFGGIGAVVGGVTGGRKSKAVCTSLEIKVTLVNTYKDAVYINLINSKTKTNSFVYKNAQKTAHTYLSAFEVIASVNEKNNSKQGYITPSSAKEIKEYKELFDMGAITKDEYEAKKKQLLNL